LWNIFDFAWGLDESFRSTKLTGGASIREHGIKDNSRSSVRACWGRELDQETRMPQPCGLHLIEVLLLGSPCWFYRTESSLELRLGWGCRGLEEMAEEEPSPLGFGLIPKRWPWVLKLGSFVIRMVCGTFPAFLSVELRGEGGDDY